jgi:uncharacterized protein YjeT (DUF2065 family)
VEFPNQPKESMTMKVIAYLLGFGHIAVSTCLILYTREILDWLQGLIRKYPLKYLAAIPTVYGLLFLISASAAVYPWVFRFIGLLAVIEAVVAFTNPQKIYSQMLDGYFGKVSVQANRMFGIIGVILGTVILAWIM